MATSSIVGLAKHFLAGPIDSALFVRIVIAPEFASPAGETQAITTIALPHRGETAPHHNRIEKPSLQFRDAEFRRDRYAKEPERDRTETGVGI
jgi:hypothetical protein